jgi:putative ABC transport system substrate-binding protein
MQRRRFITVLGSFACWPVAVRAQQKSMPVIGFLSLGSPLTRADFLAPFLQGLRENGYVEGRNISIEYRWAETDVDRFPALAVELARLNVDVLVAAGGTRAALAAKRATSTIPIVFTAVGDPVQEGLVASLARPGGNITGSSFFAPQLIGKRVQLLKEAVPEADLIAVLLKPDAASAEVLQTRLQEADASVRTLGARLKVVEARGPDDFDRAFLDISSAGSGALSVFATPLFVIERKRIAELATTHRLPAVSEFREFAEAGGLMSYGPNIPDLAWRAAGYVAKILKGARPADLPVEQPTKFELVINMKTAKALGLTIPPALLARADEVIE